MRLPSNLGIISLIVVLLTVSMAGVLLHDLRLGSADIAGATMQDPLQQRIDAMSIEWKIGQMLMAGVAGQALTDDARYLIGELHVGNVVLMPRNIDSPRQVFELTRHLQTVARDANGVGLLIATDQEGGLVQRLRVIDDFTPMPNAVVVGATGRPDLVRSYGRMVGNEMRAVGVNMDLAPVLDVNDNPQNPVIGPRAFGTTPDVVERAGLAFLAGLHDAGIIGAGKHFPGHGNTSTDSHFTVPVVHKERAALGEVELRPFRAAVNAGIDAIMPAHVVYPALDPSNVPATVSRAMLTELLRGELGFEGVIITDDMGMAGIREIYAPEEAAVQAVLAGQDLLLCARLPGTGPGCTPEMLVQLRSGLLQAVASERISVTRVDESVRRVLTLKARYQVGPASGDGLERVGSAEHLRVVADVLEAAGR
jgi:beta-N-acetylhexosaminidase